MSAACVLALNRRTGGVHGRRGDLHGKAESRGCSLPVCIGHLWKSPPRTSLLPAQPVHFFPSRQQVVEQQRMPWETARVRDAIKSLCIIPGLDRMESLIPVLQPSFR